MAESNVDPSAPPLSSTTPSRSPKTRSQSDPPAAPSLQPSPTFRERLRGESKDDHAVPSTPSQPKPPRRPELLSRGLSLHMPPPSPHAGPAEQNVNVQWQTSRPAPLSPKLDEREIYMQSQNLSASPATSLPRHSRGLDFSRASSTLHHTTIADSEPPSSPVMQKGMAIPPRKGSMSSMMLDSPNTNVAMGGWASLAPERSTVSSSVGSVNMIGSDSESSDSDEDASMCGDDQEDPVYTTPQVHKLQNPSVATPFAISGCGPQTPGGGQWGTGAAFSPAQTSLMKTMRRNKVHKTGRKSRKSSSSASNSGYSSMASPRTTSPPPLRSIEGAGTNGPAQGYFAWAANAARSRRESLALGTDGMHLSSGNDSGDEASRDNTAPSTPGVVRRPVTRRGNLLPKTKGFARIRAALMEEAAPVDTEIRRESETMTQVRERDSTVPDLDLNARPGTATSASSPNLLPAVPESAQEDFGHEVLDAEHTGAGRSLGTMNFAAQASRSNSGTDYWNRMNSSMRTPPPNFGRQGSSAMSDVNMDSPAPGGPQGGNGIPDSFWRHRPRARSSASDASEAMFATAAMPVNQNSAVNDDVVLKKFKRRREDDFDIATIKRRAVSPGMSAQNSPVLTHSPPMKGEGGIWGHPPEKKGGEGVLNGRSNSGGSNGLSNGGTLLAQGKKLGLQGMVDTNDGLMHMSLE